MPTPYVVTNCEFNVIAGGSLRFETSGPDGIIMPLIETFTSFEEPTKLILTIAPLDNQAGNIFEIEHTIILSENNGQTNMTIICIILSAGQHANQFLNGMRSGLIQAFDQLVELVTKV